jgi:hypothetical protein
MLISTGGNAGLIARDGEQASRLGAAVVKRDERQAGEPQEVAVHEAVAEAARAFELYLPPLDDDERVVPFRLVVRPRVTRFDDDRPEFERRPLGVHHP